MFSKQLYTACDTVVFLDFPPLLCLWRVLERRVQFYNKSRPGAGADCPERLNWEFLRWIWSYRRKRRPKILEKLSAAESKGKQVIVLSESKALENFAAQTARDMG